VCINLYAPRKACSRTIDDDILARAVKDNDVLFLGSAHPVPAFDWFRRWHCMAWRVSNSLEQCRHLNPKAWVLLSCPADRITDETASRLQCPGIWITDALAKIDDRYCPEETCSKKMRINDKQRVCSVLRMMLRALSLATVQVIQNAGDTEGICNHKHAGCVSHGGKDNLKMTTSSYTTKS